MNTILPKEKKDDYQKGGSDQSKKKTLRKKKRKKDLLTSTKALIGLCNKGTHQKISHKSHKELKLEMKTIVK